MALRGVSSVYGLAVTVGALPIAACGGDDEDARNPPNKPVRAAAIGEALVLRSDAGQRLRVAVTAVQDPVKEHRFEEARISGRFVGVELRITNKGELRVRDSPWSGASLATSKGAERPTRMLIEGSCLKKRRRVISPGSSQRTCIPFRVQEGATLLKFRYTPGSGFAHYAGVWDLRA